MTDTPEPLPLIMRGPIVCLAPAFERRVRKPDGSVLADAGEPVNIDADWTFWARRFSDGDVIIIPTEGTDA